MCPKNNKTIVNAIFPLIIVALVLIYFLFFKIIIVSGPSMEPTYQNGDIIVAFRNVNDINRGDIIIFEYDGELCIKRVIGIPGDTIELKDDSVYLNGMKLLNSSYNGDNQKYEISDNNYFVMGDNYKISNDSRYFGLINTDSIKYKGW